MSERTQSAEVTEQIISPQGEKLLKVLSDSYARGDGYALEFVADPKITTFATTYELTDDASIKVHLSADLLRRVEAEERLDLLGFATLHELGHVKRFQAQPPTELPEAKDSYFHNIVDDIAINYGNARRTRFVHNMTKRVYDDQLFPRAKRSELTAAPRHQQFMEALLVLAMTTNAHAKVDATQVLEQASLSGLDQSVVGAINDVLAHKENGASFNLLAQLRAHGDDFTYTSRIADIIRKHYDTLYEADKSDQQPCTDNDNCNAPNDNKDVQFDYSESGSCKHGQPQTHSEQPPVEPPELNNKDSKAPKPEDENNPANVPQPEAAPKDDTSLDIQAIAEEIAESVKQVLPEAETTDEDGKDLTAEQLARLREELNLDEADFAGYLQIRQQYANEIRALQDILLQLRQEQQNEFLAPRREVAARGYRLNVPKLVKAIAAGQLGGNPDIWKHPSMVERTELEFDGLDLYLLCDTSASMATGGKAEAAASSAVVLQEGLLGSSQQMAGEHTPLVRLQIQAFGASQQVLCELTDQPPLRDLGRTYRALRHPNSSGTYVAEALKDIKPEASRLSVVVVVSDGEFHDSSTAVVAGQKLADQNVGIIQLVFEGTGAVALARTAKRVNLATARELPARLLPILPDLVDLIRRKANA